VLSYGWLPTGLATNCVCGQGFSVDQEASNCAHNHVCHVIIYFKIFYPDTEAVHRWLKPAV